MKLEFWVLSSEDLDSWEHAGKCACGRKVFLSPECLRCALRDAEASAPVEASDPEETGDLVGAVGRQSAAPIILLSKE